MDEVQFNILNIATNECWFHKKTIGRKVMHTQYKVWTILIICYGLHYLIYEWSKQENNHEIKVIQSTSVLTDWGLQKIY